MCCISHDCQVTYEIEGFIEKNRDSLPEPVADALRFTSLQLLGILFTTSGGGGGEGGGGGRSRGDQLRKSFLRKRYIVHNLHLPSSSIYGVRELVYVLSPVKILDDIFGKCEISV